MKKVLFIDRDGTLIVEPEDEQIDSLEKLEYLPKVFTELGKIAASKIYELVIITNQDGLGTDSFPEDTFWPAQNKMLKAFENEGIIFDDIVIDKTFPHENAPTRKPGTALLQKYIDGDYDLSNSYVIGDRLSDIQLAKNLGSQGILINDGSLTGQLKKDGLEDSCALITESWKEINDQVCNTKREASVRRTTKETDISITVDLNGSGQSNISTGLDFFDHMLEQISRHGNLDLDINVKGDLHIDEHHTIEDTAITLGETFIQALGDKRGIERYGFCLPMDDCLAQVAIDFGGRNWIVWEAEFKREMVGKCRQRCFFISSNHSLTHQNQI